MAESAARKKWRVAYYQKRVDEKRCVQCGEQDERTLSGRVYCVKCAAVHYKNPKVRTPEMRDRENADKREWARMAKAKQICVKCGRKDKYTVSGKNHCLYCSTKINTRSRELRATVKGDKLREQGKNRRAAWKEQGLCSCCGGKREDLKYKMCIDCRMRYKLARHKRERENGTAKKPRGADGRCWQCNRAPAMKGKRLCAECYTKKIKIIDESGWKKGATHGNGKNTA